MLPDLTGPTVKQVCILFIAGWLALGSLDFTNASGTICGYQLLLITIGVRIRSLVTIFA